MAIQPFQPFRGASDNFTSGRNGTDAYDTDVYKRPCYSFDECDRRGMKIAFLTCRDNAEARFSISEESCQPTSASNGSGRNVYENFKHRSLYEFGRSGVGQLGSFNSPVLVIRSKVFESRGRALRRKCALDSLEGALLLIYLGHRVIKLADLRDRRVLEECSQKRRLPLEYHAMIL